MTDINEEIAFWDEKSKMMINLEHYIFGVYFAIIVITSLMMLYVVIVVNKRREFFYIAIPLTFLASACIGIHLVYAMAVGPVDETNELDYEAISLGFSVRYMFYTLGH